MIDKKYTTRFILDLVWIGFVGIGFTCSSVSGQTDQSHLEYKIPSDALKRGPFSYRGSDEESYYTYTVKADNEFGQEIIAREYFTNKKRRKLELFKNKKKHGLWKIWYLNGKLKSQSAYNMDIMDGPFKTWKKSGELTSSYTFKKGNGQKRMYHDNGKLMVDQKYEDNTIVGNYVTLYDNGQVRGLSWRSTKSHIGYHFSFDRNGEIYRIMTFDKNVRGGGWGYLKGVIVSYADDGTFHKIEYRIGELESTKAEYLKAREKIKTLPPVYDDPQKYKEWLTDEMKQVINRYKSIPPVKIPVEFDKLDNPLSKEGKPVILPKLK